MHSHLDLKKKKKNLYFILHYQVVTFLFYKTLNHILYFVIYSIKIICFLHIPTTTTTTTTRLKEKKRPRHRNSITSTYPPFTTTIATKTKPNLDPTTPTPTLTTKDHKTSATPTLSGCGPPDKKNHCDNPH